MPALDYSVLELGCGNGANLLPLAHYRPHARFVGVDGSRRAIEMAEARRRELDLRNLSFIHADFVSAADHVGGRFDFILMHGVFSWVSPRTRAELLELCAARLAPAGLLYLNYNAKPGWNIRGMVRDFLLAQTARATGLGARANLAREVAASVAASLEGLEHPYSQLMQRECRFVCESHPSYVAHEFLTEHNHAFWRSEFLDIAGRYGFQYVADADFNYESGRIPDGIAEQIAASGLDRSSLEDTIDLLSYRQLHSPILSKAGLMARSPESHELAELFVASPLVRTSEQQPWPRFRHPSGYEVDAREQPICQALDVLSSLWPRGARLASLFEPVDPWLEDILLLHRHGLLELRVVEPDLATAATALRSCEERWGGYVTTPYHTYEIIRADADE
ncbi:MAG TPA: class I SAM-dependent methyltransferase [Polyangiaceae bacterium]